MGRWRDPTYMIRRRGGVAAMEAAITVGQRTAAAGARRQRINNECRMYTTRRARLGMSTYLKQRRESDLIDIPTHLTMENNHQGRSAAKLQ